MVAILLAGMAWAGGATEPGVDAATAAELHTALVRADDAWSAILAEDPEGWVVFSSAMGTADALLPTLRDPILESDAHAYSCLKERQELVPSGAHRAQSGSCFDAAEPETKGRACSGEHWPVLSRGRIGPTLRRSSWVVDGEGDCRPDSAYVLQLTKRNQVVWTGYLQPDDSPWQGQAVRRKPVAAGLLGVALAGAAVSGGLAIHAHRSFNSHRAAFHDANYFPGAGASFQAEMAQLKRQQQGATLLAGVMCMGTVGAAAFYVVEW